MENYVSLQDYKQYCISMHSHYSTRLTEELLRIKQNKHLKQLKELEQAEQSKLSTLPRVKFWSNTSEHQSLSKINTEAEPEDSTLNNLKLITAILQAEYNRVTYYESYNNTSIEILPALSSEFFTYMLLKRQQDIVLH